MQGGTAACCCARCGSAAAWGGGASTQTAQRPARLCWLIFTYKMSGSQSGCSVEAIAARLTSWAAIHGSLPPDTFFAIYFPALKDGKHSRGRRRPPVAPPGALRRPPPLTAAAARLLGPQPPNHVCLATPTEGLAIMTSRDFLSLVEAMHGLLLRAGVRGLAALAQQQQVGGWGDAFGGDVCRCLLRTVWQPVYQSGLTCGLRPRPTKTRSLSAGWCGWAAGDGGGSWRSIELCRGARSSWCLGSHSATDRQAGNHRPVSAAWSHPPD